MDVWFMYVVWALRPLMLFAINIMIVSRMFVCVSFLISMCMFIVSKSLLISSATVIIRAGGAIWLYPLAMVLFNLCVVPSL